MSKLYNSSFRVFIIILSLSSAMFLANCSDDDDPAGPGDGNNNPQNTITLNGGGYNNQTTNLTAIFGGFEDGITGLVLSGVSGQDTLAVTIIIPGSSAGTFEWQAGDESDSGVLIFVGSTDYLASGDATGSTVVTAYGQVGQPISGTFSGTVISALSTQNVSISGSFSVVRSQ